MNFDWKGSTSTRVSVVFWPSSEILGGGRERAKWDLRTLDEVPSQELAKGLELLPVQDSLDAMQVQFEFSRPGILKMICDYDSSLPEPMRVEAASAHWRFIDERVARLWLIGSVPRVRYPAFMRQKRDLIRPLPGDLQLSWLALSLVRLEPLVTVLAGKMSDSQRLAGLISTEGAGRDVLRDIANIISSIERLGGGDRARRGSSALPGKADLAAFLLELGEVLADALERMDVNSLAGCSERVFDALYLVDSEYSHQVESGLAKLEDRSWWRDAQRVTDDGAGALAVAATEAVSCAERVRSTCIDVDVRGQFLDRGNGHR
ncbi:hypothetical protein ACIRSS_10055 [Amycolatopsis sp. NPDC101161]|uniref:hypothetical protein n=1 Tax=Amycolatopsis sp. NPDC101161 TaxID=3363940 RepID=UPI00380D1AD2